MPLYSPPTSSNKRFHAFGWVRFVRNDQSAVSVHRRRPNPVLLGADEAEHSFIKVLILILETGGHSGQHALLVKRTASFHLFKAKRLIYHDSAPISTKRHNAVMVKNIGTPVLLSDNAPLLPENCCNYKSEKKKAKSDIIPHRTQNGQNVWHPELNIW